MMTQLLICQYTEIIEIGLLAKSYLKIKLSQVYKAYTNKS